MNNNFFNIRFISDENSINWFQITMDYRDNNCEYCISITDYKNSMCYTQPVENKKWYNYDFGNIFRYDVKLLKFGYDKIRIVNNAKFDIKNHNFNIILKSDDEKEIKIWKYYLWLIQLKLDVKFNIIESKNYIDENYIDVIEISKNAYDYHLKRFNNSTNDYSSVKIITTLFDVLDDDKISEILKHPWFSDII